MSKTDKLIILQGVGITLQTINAGLAAVTHNATLALIVAAVVGGYQYVVQHLGNAAEPPK